ncbi:mechanosensitive ion channel family protein [Macellibacteroides fermentans]|jgi:miniconductance mechanosensitive channel|uniref:Mechanosensing system component YbdG n=1 Tax=Macellibacteroides fermentans TaxID=879969 RepID=A0A8E1ZT69_9PORP|nr:mechanosensitive ion channel domain-containing protein [Macellibacteroides fermentans]MDD3255486.1 mechanosensitive ion channel [Parabacteroides sp.]NYI47999.1 miniconductance mechanosensitive channel [Macellibacteroides fermentans]HNU38031.1 mechanosensitive ion channel [Macellibacteroides fermentans]
MEQITNWFNQKLLNFGTSVSVADYLDNFAVLLIIILLALAVDYICRYILLGAFKKFAKKTTNQLDDLIIEKKIINKGMHIIPSILIFTMLPLAYPSPADKEILVLLQKLCQIYIITVSLLFINSLLNLGVELFHRNDKFKDKPLKGFVQIVQVILFSVGIILLISILINESPSTIFTGIGASAAILMLVFKDTILGFVAGIQLSANDMLRVDDWISMPKYGADGTVIEITLNTVKVKNFDNTISTIPPYALISESFQNWRGMRESPGRRIKRSINLDMNSVKFCTPEMLEKYRKISLLAGYIDDTENKLQTYNQTNQIDNTILVNGRRQTNLGVFRAYLQRYLESLPEVNKEMICMVRHLQPTEKGIPMELYFFSSIKDWVIYETIQADVFDHVLAVIPEFDLQIFQELSGSDVRMFVKTENR